MKIIKAGEVIAELRDTPKDFEAGVNRGMLWVAVGDDDVKLEHYSNARAHEILRTLSDAYFAGQPEFILPEE